MITATPAFTDAVFFTPNNGRILITAIDDIVTGRFYNWRADFQSCRLTSKRRQHVERMPLTSGAHWASNQAVDSVQAREPLLSVFLLSSTTHLRSNIRHQDKPSRHSAASPVSPLLLLLLQMLLSC